MTDTAHYIIRKQILDIRHRRNGNAYARQTEMSSRYRKEVVPLLEKACRELCPADCLIKIDTLVVTLPPMTESRYRATWTEEVKKAFRQSLSQAIAQAYEPQHRNATIHCHTDANLQFLAFFLYTGTLPWSYSKNQDRSLKTIFRELIVKETAAVRRLLIEGLKQPSFTKRLCYQFPSLILTGLFPILEPVHTERILNYYNTLHYCFEKAGYFSTHSDTVFLLHYHSLRQLAQQRYRGEKQYIAQMLQEMSHSWKTSYQDLLSSLEQAMKSVKTQRPKSSLRSILRALYKETTTVSEAREITYKSTTTFPQRLEREKKETVEKLSQTDQQQFVRKKEYFREAESAGKIPAEAYKRLEIFSKELFKDVSLQGENKWDIPNREQGVLHPETIYLQNAGMVIVWSFFRQLFEALNITEKQQFVNEDKQYRAVHLLQYLVNGKENCNEYQLILNKLLCGLALSEPIPQHVSLMKEEKEATEDLIKAAMGHWPVMKNTSVKGFREAFLMRDGKLSRDNNSWLLKVEQKSYDMILDKLPWTIRLIKLPWMTEALFVEW